MTSPPNFNGVCDQCFPSQQPCIFSTPPSNPNGHWRCNSCRFFGFNCDYPQDTPASPPAIPTTPPLEQVMPNVIPSSPYEDWSHLIGVEPEYHSPPPPSIAAHSVETVYPSDDPFFTGIGDTTMDWKNDAITELSWVVWRHFDNAMRIIKDTGVEIPNLANNSYHRSRDIVIDEYISRNTYTGNIPPTLETFIPFEHHAQRANDEHVHPTNSAPTVSDSSDELSSNASTAPIASDISDHIDPQLFQM